VTIAYLLAGWLFFVGLYGVVTSRNFLHLVMCLGVLQSSTYVLLLEIGYKVGGEAPIFETGPPTRHAVDPVVQSLALTDVVVGVTVASLLCALVVQAYKRTGGIDPADVGEMRG
jgi:multicomponent Na+:H+ antiporter subunit C